MRNLFRCFSFYFMFRKSFVLILSLSSQCARRGLQCVRPTESRRGVRKGRGRDAEGNANEEMTATLELAPRRVRSCGEDHVHDDEMEDNTEDTCMVEDQNLSTSIEV